MPPARRFQLKSKTFLLTYPQCATDPEKIYDDLKGLTAENFRFCIIASELHADGSPHRHVYLVLKEIKRCGAANCFDLPSTGHGDYKSVKNSNKDRVRAVAYVKKDDCYTLYDIDEANLAVYLASPSKNMDKEIAEALLAGKACEELVTENPAYAMRNLKKMKEFEAFATMMKQTTPPNRFSEVSISACACPSCAILDAIGGAEVDKQNATIIMNWLNDRIRRHKEDNMLPIRTRQLWIVSPPGVGKTTFVSKLKLCLSIYDIPKTEDFYDTWRNGRYDLAVLDEYHGQKSVGWLNTWLDGSTTTLRIKGGQYIKNDNVPTLILSNHDPHEVYSNAMSKNHNILDPMLCEPARIEVIHITTRVMHMLDCFSTPILPKRALTPMPEEPPLFTVDEEDTLLSGLLCDEDFLDAISIPDISVCTTDPYDGDDEVLFDYE